MPDELAVFELAPLSCCSWNRYVPAGNGSPGAVPMSLLAEMLAFVDMKL